MKRVTTTATLLFVATGLVLDARAQDVSPTTGELHYTDVALEIDGQFDEAWANAPAYEYPFGDPGHMFGAWTIPDQQQYTTGPEDISGHTRVLWDESYLYVWVQLTDDEPFSIGFNECWRNDAVELTLDGGNEKATSYDANDAYLAFRLGGDVEDWDPDICTLSVLDREKAIANIVYGTAVTDTGWVMEIRVPWENIDVEPANGLSIGFNTVACDSDGRMSGTQPQRDVALSWAEHSTGNGWQNPQAMGTMTLVGGPGGSVANAAFSTDPPVRVLVGEEIIFDASSSTAPADIVTYDWDFGDGNTGSGVSVSHTYSELGRYIVTLSIADAGGAQGTAERPITAWDGIGLVETPLGIPQAPSVPEIDGVMEEAWANAQRVRVATRANNALPDGPEDLSAEALVMWDADNLYIFFDVTDDDLQNDSDDTFQDDSVEFYLDGGHERAAAYDANDGQFEMGWGTSAFTGTNPGVTGASFVTIARDDETGYTVEAVMPWANVGVENPTIGDVLGFEAMVNDDDGGGDRSHKLAWFAPEGTDLAYIDASVFGTARLVEEVETATEPGSHLPVHFAIESIYPNPFNPSTTAVVMAQTAGAYEVQVYNAIGQLVRVHEVHAAAPGRLQVGLDLSGEASGLYLVSVRSLASGNVATARAVFLK